MSEDVHGLKKLLRYYRMKCKDLTIQNEDLKSLHEYIARHK